MRYLVTLTNTKTWNAVKLNVGADNESHALYRALLVVACNHQGHVHDMVTISLVGANPSVQLCSFELIADHDVEVLERIHQHNLSPLIEGGDSVEE